MNNQIFYFFYNYAYQSVFFDKLVIFCAVYLPYVVLLLAGLFLLFHHDVLPSSNPFKEFLKKWKEICLVFFSSGLAWCISKILKIIINTPRPFDAFSNVHSLFPETGAGFPSGHATAFSALAIAIFLSHKKAGYVFIFFAFIIGIARIIGGVHFPLDIIGGFVLGSAIAYLLKKM